MINPVGPRPPLPVARQDMASLGAAPVSRDEVVPLTQELVRIDSSPANLVPGENATADVMEAYARGAGLDVERFETTRGRPMLIVTLPGTDPSLPAVGFVHHSDVVGIEGKWSLGAPFSGDLTKDAHGRDVLVGRGSIDTKGPAAQILVAMKQLESSPPKRTTKLYVFPDEEKGGAEGAYLVARDHPEKLRDVRYWVVEASGILSREVLASIGAKRDAPYLAVAQKYTVPLQAELKTAVPADQAVRRTLQALKSLDEHLAARPWSFLGNDDETHESFRRLGSFVGGFKGWMLRHFWHTGFVRRRMGAEVAAANHTDVSKTDLYLSTNAAGGVGGPNVKPSSASAVVELALQAAAVEEGMTPQAGAALALVREGESSVEEALRVVWLD